MVVKICLLILCIFYFCIEVSWDISALGVEKTTQFIPILVLLLQWYILRAFALDFVSENVLQAHLNRVAYGSCMTAIIWACLKQQMVFGVIIFSVQPITLSDLSYQPLGFLLSGSFIQLFKSTRLCDCLHLHVNKTLR